MKRLILIFALCGLLLPSAYGKTISHTFANGDTYVGEVKDSKMHGQGAMTFADGEKYVGEWKNSKPDGQGTWTYLKGNKYVGGFRDGRPNGQGTKTWPNGHKYVGEWKDGEPHGLGAYTFATGDKYVGELKDGEWHDQGTYTYADGSKYVGEYRNGKQHGQGTFTYSDGEKYVGEYKDNKMHGQGTYTYPDGDKYVGSYKNGKRHGQGTYTGADGSQYVGGFKGGNQHGQGSFTDADGSKYVGGFKGGNQNGQGTYTWASGDKYVGSYKNGKQHDQGTYTYANGDKYVGEYKNDKRHGQGTDTKASGDKYVGEYRLANKWEGTEYNASGEIIGKHLDGMPAPACNGNQKSAWGTGFAVRPNRVVTNAHVVYCCKKVTVFDLSCSGSEEVTVVSTKQESDLGLLRLGKRLKHYATLRGGKELALGEAVTAYDRRPEVNGCPQYDVGQGRVTALDWMPDDSRRMYHDSPTSKGSSGGPVLDASGSVVGVSITANVGKSGAIKLHLLKAFLKSNNARYKVRPSTKKLSLSEIKKKSDKFTVIIKCMR